MKEKICHKCEKPLPLSEFYASKQHKDGLNPWCKSCYSDAGKIRYEKRCLKNPPSFRRICDQIHHTYFSVVNQPLQAYLLGLLAADGNILERYSRITMELSVKDYELLTLIRDELAPGYSIRKRVRKEPTRFGTGASGTVTFTSREMVADIARFNIGPRKTLTMRWPVNLPMNLAPAYLLGYFDGDGFITSYAASNHTYAVWGLTSGSIEFLNDVISIVKEQIGITIRGPYHKSSQSFVIRAYGTRAVAIDQWLHADGLGLSRKKVC
jgi:hypothetical protein